MLKCCLDIFNKYFIFRSNFWSFYVIKSVTQNIWYRNYRAECLNVCELQPMYYFSPPRYETTRNNAIQESLSQALLFLYRVLIPPFDKP